MEMNIRVEQLCVSFFGHRDVREILHTEICEEPWNKQHMQEMDKIAERFCRYCDSGYLTTKTLNEYRSYDYLSDVSCWLSWL